MHPQPASDNPDYEGFSNSTQRAAARIQRALMYRWRLLCSGVDPDLMGPYCKGEELTFKDARRLSEVLHKSSKVLTWRQLEAKCHRSLGHFVAFGEALRIPTPETLAEMASIGGRPAISELLRRRDLTAKERSRLQVSGEFRALIRDLAPDLLNEKPQHSATLRLVPSSASRRCNHPDWARLARESHPTCRMDVLDHDYLDEHGRWRNDCDHPLTTVDSSPPPYLELLTGSLSADNGPDLARDLRLNEAESQTLGDFLRWWDARQRVAPETFAPGLEEAFPRRGGVSIKRGYELFRRLLFPAGLQNGWSGPGKGDLGRAIVNGYSRGFARPPLVVESDIDVDGTDPPVVYIHAWRPHSPDQLLFRRVVRDLWGQVLGYCPHGGGHWFFASPGERCCGSTGHWRQGRFVEHETEVAQPAALRPFPTDLVKRLWDALSDVDSWYARLEEVITDIGPIDDRFVDPPLLLSSREMLDVELAAGLRPTEEGTLQRVREALLGQDAGDGVGRGWGLFDLLNRPVAQGAEAGLSWPRFIRHGHAFSAMRVLSDPTDYSCRLRYAPASLAQLILEVAAADAVESSLREADAELLWGPFWCARPGCPSLFVSAELQRDAHACATESGYRGLMFSQYCSHACFQADRGKMSGHLSSNR